MKPEFVRILTYVLAGLSVTFAGVAVVLFFKLEIVKTIKELRGKTIFKETNNEKYSNSPKYSNFEQDEEDEGFDETVALVADENTYVDFNVIKNIVYVNTAETIT